MCVGSLLSVLTLAGCGNSVVVEPIAAPPVAGELKQRIRAPLCLDPRRKDYSVEELEAANVCWRQALGGAISRHDKLASAVEARERAVAQAVAAAKK